MRWWCLLCISIIFHGELCSAQPPNPITNGGFEELGPDGWAVDWEKVGAQVTITNDAHSGRNAVLLSRTPEAIERKMETGINRDWQPHSGQQGTMLSQRKGGVKFWYKVPGAPKSAHLRFYMIPMTDEPLERTGSPRVWFEIPTEHFGDGQWHQGMVAYDFTDNEKCKWVHVSPRIISDEPAQWIIDDIEWVESIGPLANIVRIGLEEVKGREGRECEVSATIKNIGDKPLAGTVELRLPDYLKVTAPEGTQQLGPVRPDEQVKVKWRVAGPRERKDTIGIVVTGGVVPASTTFTLSPELGEVWLETEQFVLWPGKETRVSLVVQNNGGAAATNIHATVRVPQEIEIVGDSSRTLNVATAGTVSRLDFRVRARRQTPLARLTCSWQAAGDLSGTLHTDFVVGSQPPKPTAPPSDAACLACDTFEIVFPRNDFGYGIGWLFARPGGELVGVMPYLARIAVKARESKIVALYASTFEQTVTATPLGASPAQIEALQPRGLTFTVSHADLQRLGLPGPIRVSLVAAGQASGSVLGSTMTYQVTCAAPKAPLITALEGPMIYWGEGSFGAEKDEALYPGLEWLENGEESSSTLDIAADHPHRQRYVAHPHMVTIPCMAVRRGKTCVGLLWHSLSRWADGSNRADLSPDRSDVDRPSAIFASPDKPAGHASHAMALMVPTVPEYVSANQREAEKPWPAQGVGATTVRLLSAIYVNPNSTSAMDVMRAWFQIYGVATPHDLPHVTKKRAAEPPAAVPAFRGYDIPSWAQAADRKGAWAEPTRSEWIDEIEWSMQAYLTTLWDEQEKGWMPYKGGPQLWFRISPRADYLYDCVIAARLTDDLNLRQRLEERISLLKSLYPTVHPEADDMGFNFDQPVPSLLGMGEEVASLMKSQDADGGWRFHPYIATSGVFKGMDYAELGYEGQEANGLVARKAWTLLRCARMTGDQAALSAGLKALDYMEKFIVPRAAQVWEVPVHTPDVLASADACEACLEAYYITGERKWLERAVYWAETGLPFLYQWDVPQYPWMRYASIPVFGATWFRGSWFGRPVQWNGLRWAFAVLKLAEVDNSYPWRMLGAGVTISAMYQQGNEEHDLAMWPDSISAIDATKSGWIFSPSRILKNVYKLMGYEPEPITAQVKLPGGTVHINACGSISDARLEDGVLKFTVNAPEPIPTRVVLCGMQRPTWVKLNGSELPQRDVVTPGEVVGWTYHQGYSILEISPGKPGSFAVEVSPASYAACRLTPPEATQIAFDFDTDDGGWRPTHQLGPFSIAEGILSVRATGSDPYMTRSNCRIDGNRVSRVHVRIAVSAGTGIQWYWATQDSPTMAEDKVVNVPIKADGQFHDYYFEVGKHDLWRGQTITSIRLDPMAGAPEADIKIDFIRGEP